MKKRKIKHKKYTISKEFLIKEYIQNGKTLTKIASEFKFSRSNIYKHLKKYNIERRSKGRIIFPPINWKFFNTWSHDSAYILGLIITDGCIIQSRGQKLLQFAFQEKDKELLEFITNCLSQGRKIYRNNKRHQYWIPFTSDKLCNILTNKFKIIQRKSGFENLDFKIPKKYLPDLLRGILDGDGCIRCVGNALIIYISSASYKLVETIQSKLGYGKIYFKKKNGLTKTGNKMMDMYNLCFSSHNAIKFRNFIYLTNGFYLKRKRKIAFKSNIKVTNSKPYSLEEKEFIITQFILMRYLYSKTYISNYIAKSLNRTYKSIESQICKKFKAKTEVFV